LIVPGTYPVKGTLTISASGIVLRGSGEGIDPASNTVIEATRTSKGTLIQIGNGDISWNGKVSGSTVDISNEYIPVSSHTFEVEDSSPFSVGDNIIIRHPSTQAWISAVNGGDTGSDAPWNPGEIDIKFNRYITHIEGNKIKVKTPLYHELDRSLSQSYVYKYTQAGQLTENGIENLRVVVQSTGPTSEDHVETVINFSCVENCWVKDVTALHFVRAGIRFEGSTKSTVLNCTMLQPHSIITGGRRYNFCLGSHSNNILFRGCHASEARHAFVSNGTATVSGIVFTACSSVDEHTASESHRRWGEALLWDNTSMNSNNTYRVLGLYNRGDWGTGHGWTGTHQVAWNISAPDNQIVIQKPPIGQNYAVGCDATVDNNGPYSHPAGYIEGTGEELLIQSLYDAQFSERLTHGIGPDTPGRLMVTDYSYTDTTKTVALSWLDIAMDENKYILERSSDQGLSYDLLAELDADTESYTDENILQENYHYRLRAVNEIGFSAWSNIVEAIEGAPYTEIEGALLYEIFPDASGELSLSTPPARDWLANNCFGSSTNSDASDGSRSVLLKNNQSYLITPEVNAPGVLSFKVKVKPSLIVGAYLLVEKSINAGAYTEVGRFTPQNTSGFESHSINVGDASSNVKLKFRAYDPAGGEAKYYIDQVLLMENIVGVKNLHSAGDFKVIGNFVDKILVFSTSANSGHIAIVDLNGRQVFKQGLTASREINIAHLSSGMYLAVLSNGSDSQIEKFYKK